MWQQAAWIISGTFAGVATLFAAAQIYLHLTNYTQPAAQRYIIRIILMVPIYAIDSFLSLLFRPAAIYWNTLRNCYEAFVIYSFFALLLTYLGGVNTLAQTLSELPKQKHMFPFCMLRPFRPSANFLRRCQQGTLQFVLVKLLTTIVALICELCGVLDDGHFRPDRAYMYLTILDNISVTISMYCLLLFYSVCKQPLAPFRPVPKFLCVKAVIFFSFWQGVVLAILVQTGAITDVGDWSPHEISTALQNLIICIEMSLAAVAHHFAFSYKEYQGHVRTPLLPNVKATVQVRDVVDDTLLLFGPRGRGLLAPPSRVRAALLVPEAVRSYGTLAEPPVQRPGVDEDDGDGERAPRPLQTMQSQSYAAVSVPVQPADSAATV